MKALRPPIQYFGAKGNLAERIVSLFPPHKGYVEPFAGSLAVLLAKGDCGCAETVNDIDGDLMTFWRVLREQPHDFARVAALTPHSRGELDRAAETLDTGEDLERARKVWVLLTQGRSRTLRRTGWRFFVDNSTSGGYSATFLDAYRNRLLPAAERLAHVSLEQRDALDVIEQYGQCESNVLYLDPPYVKGTRSAGRYRHEMQSVVEHERILSAALECRANVVISGYTHELYEERLRNWHRIELASQSGNAADRARTEVLWMNYIPAAELDIFGDAA